MRHVDVADPARYVPNMRATPANNLAYPVLIAFPGDTGSAFYLTAGALCHYRAALKGPPHVTEPRVER